MECVGRSVETPTCRFTYTAQEAREDELAVPVALSDRFCVTV